MPFKNVEDKRRAQAKYQAKPEQKKKRAARNAARREMMERGLVRKGDGKDVHHKDNNPRNNSRSNLQVTSRSKNRAYARKSNGKPKHSGAK